LNNKKRLKNFKKLNTQTLLSQVIAFQKSKVSPNIILVLVLMLVCAVMAIINPIFLSTANAIIILTEFSVIFVLGIGETFPILMGGIDLSVAGVATLSTMAVLQLLNLGLGYLAFPIAVAIGAGMGFLTGVIHVKGKLPSFLVSLGTMGISMGIAYTLCHGMPLNMSPEQLHYREWVIGSFFGVPNIILNAFIVFFICFFLERYTRFGRYIKAIGAGEKVARLSGVPVDKYKILGFALCGACAGLAGILLTMRLSVGSPRSAEPMLLTAIAVVVLGGTSITGGIGGVPRTLIGALIISVIRNGMTIGDIGVFYQQIIEGIIVIAAVAGTLDRSKIPIIK